MPVSIPRSFVKTDIGGIMFYMPSCATVYDNAGVALSTPVEEAQEEVLEQNQEESTVVAPAVVQTSKIEKVEKKKEPEKLVK